MFRDAERKMKVVRGCPIDVYSASYMHQYSYFYKLQHAGQASEAVRDTCFEYIVDSSFQNDDIGNREVLDKACELHADTVIPKDYPGERHRTRESMKEFISMYEPSEMRPDPMIVVQPRTTRSLNRTKSSTVSSVTSRSAGCTTSHQKDR